MRYLDLSQEEMDKYDSALVAISDKIRIIHALGLQKTLLADLLHIVPEELEVLIAHAKEMNIGNNKLRNRSW
jgi:uncharacterized membrane protein